MKIFVRDAQPHESARSCVLCLKPATTVVFKQGAPGRDGVPTINLSSRRFACDDCKPKNLVPVQPLESEAAGG